METSPHPNTQAGSAHPPAAETTPGAPHISPLASALTPDVTLIAVPR